MHALPSYPYMTDGTVHNALSSVRSLSVRPHITAQTHTLKHLQTEPPTEGQLLATPTAEEVEKALEKELQGACGYQALIRDGWLRAHVQTCARTQPLLACMHRLVRQNTCRSNGTHISDIHSLSLSLLCQNCRTPASPEVMRDGRGSSVSLSLYHDDRQ